MFLPSGDEDVGGAERRAHAQIGDQLRRAAASAIGIVEQ
jgi:hypothetical protein